MNVQWTDTMIPLTTCPHGKRRVRVRVMVAQTHARLDIFTQIRTRTLAFKLFSYAYPYPHPHLGFQTVLIRVPGRVQVIPVGKNTHLDHLTQFKL